MIIAILRKLTGLRRKRKPRCKLFTATDTRELATEGWGAWRYGVVTGMGVAAFEVGYWCCGSLTRIRQVKGR